NVDKGLLLLADQPLIVQAVKPLQGHIGQLLISANRTLHDYARYGQVVTDNPLFPAYSGPLAGLSSALDACSTDWLVVVPVDVTGVPANFVARLSSVAYGTASGLVFAKCGSHEHPLCAMMRTSLKESLRTFLEKGGRRVFEWMSLHNA